MKRKVKALLALALTLALVSTTLGDNWLYVSAENAAEAKEQSDEPTAAAEEETDEPAAAPEEAAPEETAPVEEAAAAEEETAPVEPVPEEKQTEEQKLEAAEAPAEQPTEAPAMADEQKQPTDNPVPADEQKQPAESPAPADEQKQATENPAPADEQKQPAETPAEQPTEAPAADTAAPAAPAEVPAADAEVKEAEKAPEAEVPGADEKDTETVEEEIGLIEQTIEAFVDTEEKDVVITLTGEMPEGATASACPVDISMDGVNIISAYDITIYDADGQEFQPSEEKPLQVKIEDDAVRKALEENTELEVYHLEDAEAEPEQVQEVNLEAAAVEFQAESFSIYAVVMPEKHFTHTYQFMDEDGNPIEDIQEQILSAKETLTEPKSPTKDHAVFEGWYTAQNGGEKFNKFGQQEPELKESVITTLYARFTTVYYVYYKAGSQADSKVLFTQIYHDGSAKIVTGDIPFTPENTEEALIGWTTVVGGTEPETSLVIKDDDVTLYPVVKKAHWLNYHSMGGTSVEPVYVLAGNATQNDQSPVRKGYTFGGWYTDQSYRQQFEFGNILDKDQDLYAKWNPAMVEYTVVYWQENADDDEYSYVETEKKTGYSDSEATYTAKSYLNFTLNKAKTDAEKVTISADGNSIKNVYYSRNVYTIYFVTEPTCGKEEHTHTDRLWPLGCYDILGNLICGKEEHKHEASCYAGTTILTISQKYDSDISKYWEEDPIKKLLDEGYVWESSLTGKYYSFLQKMPKNNIIMKQTKWNGLKHTWYYYLEALNGIAPNSELTKNVEGKTYYLYHTTVIYGSTNTVLTYEEDYFPLTGFKQRDEDVPKFTWNVKKSCYEASLYYLREAYEIDFHTNNTNNDVIKKSEILYESDLSNIVPKEYEIGKTTKTLNGVTYYFDGWYDNQYLQGNAYDFTGKKMPAKNLAYYAKWSSRKVTLSFNSTGGTEIESQILDQGIAGVKPKNPVRDGFKFAGWVKKDGTPFSFATVIMNDTTIYAKWISNSQYTLTYDPGAGTGDAVIDPNGYVNGAEVKLKEVPEGFQPPEEHYGFVCWNTAKDGSGTDYYPGAGYVMPEENVTLYAKWAPIRKTTLVYDYNGGTWEEKTKSDAIDIKIPNSVYRIDNRIPVRDGYEFLGWSIKKDVSEGETLLKVNDGIQVDTLAEETNYLYAQWRKLKEVTFTVEKLVDGNMGDHNKEFEFTYSIWKGNEKLSEGTFKLSDGNENSIPNITEGCTVEIQEILVTGYTTTINASVTNENESDETGKFSYTVAKNSEENITVQYTNSKTMVTPTGVATNGMTSILMLLAGLGMAVVMLLTGRRRKI